MHWQLTSILYTLHSSQFYLYNHTNNIKLKLNAQASALSSLMHTLHPPCFLQSVRLIKLQTHTYCFQHYHVIVCHIPLIGPYSPAGPPEVVLWCFLPGFRQIWLENSVGLLVIPAGVVVHSAVSGVSPPWALDPLQVIQIYSAYLALTVGGKVVKMTWITQPRC